MVKNSLAEMLIRFRAIEFGDFTLASGAKSPYYIDVKTAVTRPELLSAIAGTIAAVHDFDVVAGVAVGGVPLCVATALAKNRPYAIIRASEKSHGRKGVIIGDVNDKDVLLVEDVTTSGGSALYGINALRDAGARVDRVVTVVDREQGAEAMLASHGIRIIPLVRLHEILKE
ncbi:MAG: orotate phosphoribosyltransferase [Methanoregula sp.]|jgi:orotate phosphoribosyltransferase|uniref:orotate phosphoribosyltransferase n=1 Tax=Methanoregula sp. TaxID=2052170 RepID=UPI0025E84FB1|nr:orotate phosphoribosyltransferase [Methanoregula sp.]MCK9630789.1 orotate phosphoribosyltransferase [Methanoregula sp.]